MPADVKFMVGTWRMPLILLRGRGRISRTFGAPGVATGRAGRGGRGFLGGLGGVFAARTAWEWRVERRERSWDFELGSLFAAWRRRVSYCSYCQLESQILIKLLQVLDGEDN